MAGKYFKKYLVTLGVIANFFLLFLFFTTALQIKVDIGDKTPKGRSLIVCLPPLSSNQCSQQATSPVFFLHSAYRGMLQTAFTTIHQMKDGISLQWCN